MLYNAGTFLKTYIRAYPTSHLALKSAFIWGTQKQVSHDLSFHGSAG